jgi:hypothetical protein
VSTVRFNPGSKAWAREEKRLYENQCAFRCHACREVVSADDGAADDMPDACSSCWVNARIAKAKK